MSFSIQLGNFLYKNAYFLYRPMYFLFKKKQDAFEIGLLQQHVKKGDVVLDIGSNIGFYAQILSGLTGDKGKVHCFEPDVKNFSFLTRNCISRNNIILNNKAVGERTETLTFYTSKELNVDHRTYKPEEYEQEIPVEAISIDDYLKAPAKVDFIKIDIQGYEVPALKGMQRVLNENANVKLISEFWPYGLKQAGSSASEYYDLLLKSGFVCSLIEGDQLISLDRSTVTKLESYASSKERYFNIFAVKGNV